MQDDKRIERIRKGDTDAAAALVEAYWARIFGYLCRISYNRHDAEDLTQQTFLQAFERLAQYATGTNFQAWLYRIATNLFRDHCRKTKRRAGAAEEVVAATPPSAAPEAQARERELAHAAERAIMQLPEDLRVALTLRINEGRPHREIAEITGADEGTVRWRVHEARRRLADMLRAYL